MAAAAEKRPAALAKIARPKSAGAVLRSRLFKQLDEAFGQPTLWIQAPAGSGKTSLISSYVDIRGLDCLWYEIDEGDSDPATFFHYLRLAADSFSSDGAAELPALTPEFLPAINVFARRHFEGLCPLLKPPAVLILDNYQDLPASAPLHELLADVGANLPQGVTMVFVSRTEPPSAFARLRMHRNMPVLGWEDLRLTPAEAHELASSVSRVSLPPSFISRCHAAAQGWIAGFILLLNQRLDHQSEPMPFDGSDRQLLFDYFACELFERVPPATQTALLTIAVCPQVTLPIARAMLGDEGAAHVLAELQQSHLFVSKREGAESVYEFHPLFRTFLLARGKTVFAPGHYRDLHRRAGTILLDARQIDDAAQLFLDAGDDDALASLVLSSARGLIAEGRHQTLCQWIAGIEARTLANNGWLLFWRGAGLLAGDPRQARQDFETAFSIFEDNEDVVGLYLSWAAAVECYLVEWADFRGLDDCLSRFVRLRERYPALPMPEVEVRVYAALLLLTYHQPGYPELPVWAEHAAGLLASDTAAVVRLGLCANLISYHVWKGQLNQAAWALGVMRRLLGMPGAPSLYVTFLQVLGAMHAWMTGTAGDCLKLVKEGLEQARSAGVHVWDFHLHIQGAYGALASGQTDDAEGFLRGAFALLMNHRHLDTGHYYFALGLVAEQRGDYASTVQHFDTALATAECSGAPIPQATTHASLIYPLYRLGRIEEADKHLQLALRLSAKTGSQVVEYCCHFNQARIELDRGEKESALGHLARALTLTRESGDLVSGWWGPKEMARLYNVALEGEIEVPYLQTLIRRIGLAPAGLVEAASDRWPWPIRIHTLGGFDIIVDDVALRWSGKAKKKPLDLLKTLVAFGGRGVSEAKLCEVLWPEAEGDVAHRDFSITLHRLRRLLGNEKALRIENGCLTLDRNLVWIDIWAFEARLFSSESFFQSTDDAVSRIVSALTLYRGAFLSEDSSACLLVPRDRLRSKFRRAAERLGALLESCGRCSEAVDWYLKALEADPLAEAIQVRLMESYDRLGCRAEALAVYQRCRQVLLTQLGIMPSPETQALYQRLLTAPSAAPTDGAGT